MILESILTKHAKKFIDPKHSKAELRGTLFDGEGSAYAVDAIQCLKVSGLVPIGFPWIQGLNGKPVEADPSHLPVLDKIFSRELDAITNVKVKELLGAVKLLHSIQKEDLKSKDSKHKYQMKVTFISEEGAFILRYEGFDVTGSIEIGSCDKDFRMSVNCKRLLDCISVFEKDFETIDISADKTMMRFDTENVSTLLVRLS